MREDTTMVCIWIVLAALAGLGFVLVFWSTARKELEGTGELQALKDRDAFMGVMRSFLDAKYVRNPLYNASPPANDLELYEFYRKWMKRFSGNPWKIVPIALAIQLSMGLLAVGKYGQLDMGTVLTYLFSCTALVTLVSLLAVWGIKKRTAVLAILDQRFREFTEGDRTSLVQSDPQDRYSQAYRLNAIEAMPTLATDQDMTAAPRSLAEGSFILRGGLGCLAGIAFFLLAVFGGGILFIEIFGIDESVFPVFLLTGFIGMIVVWVALMSYWGFKKQRLDEAGRQQGSSPPPPYTRPGVIPPYGRPSSRPPPQAAGSICRGCGNLVDPAAEACPHCGYSLRQA